MRTACLPVVLTFMLSAMMLGQSMNPPYLSEMPSVERIMQDVKGTDPADTFARQMATLLEMKKIVEDMAWGLEHRAFNKLTPDESKLTAEYNKAFNDRLASSGKKAFNATGNYYGPKFRSAVLSQFFSQNFLQLYYKADATEMARQQKLSQPQENIFGADKAPAGGMSSPQMGDALKGFAKAITGLTGQAAPDGMRINGIYKGGGAGIGFTVSTASVSCEDLVPDGREYSLEPGGSQIRVTIANEGQPIVMTLRSDGSLSGSGTVTVAGRVQVGTWKVWIPDTVNNTYYGYPTTGHYENQPIYKPKSARCTFGAMSPTGAYGANVGNAVRFAQGLAGQHPPEFKITPGVRLVGLYSGAGGAIEFEEDSATIKCGGSKKEIGYAVVPNGNQFLVTMDGGGTLALDAGGRLTTQKQRPAGLHCRNASTWRRCACGWNASGRCGQQQRQQWKQRSHRTGDSGASEWVTVLGRRRECDRRPHLRRQPGRLCDSADQSGVPSSGGNIGGVGLGAGLQQRPTSLPARLQRDGCCECENSDARRRREGKFSRTAGGSLLRFWLNQIRQRPFAVEPSR